MDRRAAKEQWKKSSSRFCYTRKHSCIHHTMHTCIQSCDHTHTQKRNQEGGAWKWKKWRHFDDVFWWRNLM